jgi:hypothetical protein
MRIVFTNKIAGCRVEQIGIGQQRILMIVDQLRGGVEGEQVIDCRRQFKRPL